LSELSSRLRQPPFSALTLTSRRQVLASLEGDPFARAIGFALGAAALLALGLAALGLWVTLLSELRDERGDFFDLEAQGMTPEMLRAQLRIRTLALLVFSVLAGVALGLVLSRLVVSLVHVTAGTGTPDPPLVLQPGWDVIALALAGLVMGAGLLAELSVHGAFRRETPERVPWSLE